MTRLRIVLLSLCVAAMLGACDKSGPPAAGPPTLAMRAKAMLAALTHKAQSAVAKPEPWAPQLPAIAAAQVPQILQQAEQALDLGQIERGNSPGPGALELFLAVLKVDPKNVQAQQGVDHCVEALLERGRIAMQAGRLADAQRVATIAGTVRPEHRDLPGYRAYFDKARQAETMVVQSDVLISNGELTQAKLRDGIQFLRDALVIFPDFQPAIVAQTHWSKMYQQLAWQAAGKDDYALADRLLQQALAFEPDSIDARVLGLRIVERRQARTDALDTQANQAVDALQLNRADALLAQLEKIAAQSARPDALSQRIFLARHYGPFKPGQVFAEKMPAGATGPELVVIPFGKFTMGSPDTEPARQDSEGPQREIYFDRGFALGRNEVTVAEFRQFVAATKYSTVATRQNSSTVFDEKGGSMAEHVGVDWRRDFVGRIAPDERPVVHIAFEDAQAYAAWLSKQTGQHYRLPSEAEWEYVERAGSNSVYPWGDSAPKKLVGNLTGDGDKSIVGRSWGTPIAGYTDYFWGPAPVRSFPAEPWGTFDMVGNVSEWVLDCWHDSYQRAPMDGSAWINPGCEQRVARGASWASSLDQARSAARVAANANSSNPWLGFRVLRELPTSSD
jgi:formylglycine-generating enzyme required for sulfatase activity